MSGIPADLIVIIALAVFVVWKYRQVLGHKTGHDVENPRNRIQQRKDQAEERVVQLKKYQNDDDYLGDAETATQPDVELETLEDAKLKKIFEKMKELDPSFTLDDFVKGAKGAFEMVMDAFNEADRATLKMLLSDELYTEFERELKQYEKKKQIPNTTLVSILSADAQEANLTKGQASITVRFLSEQIHIVKDEKGEVVEGDISRIEQVEDEWVFERNMKSRNPNWTITDM